MTERLRNSMHLFLAGAASLAVCLAGHAPQNRNASKSLCAHDSFRRCYDESSNAVRFFHSLTCSAAFAGSVECPAFVNSYHIVSTNVMIRNQRVD
jgi:hypothetical protein